MALGANRNEVLRLALFEGMRPTFAGLAIGIPGALAFRTDDAEHAVRRESNGPRHVPHRAGDSAPRGSGG